MPSNLGGLTSGLPSEIVFLHAFGVGAQRNVWTPEGGSVGRKGEGRPATEFERVEMDSSVEPRGAAWVPGVQRNETDRKSAWA